MKRFISNLLTVCFICYMILLVYFLFFSEEYGRNEPYTTYQYNLELFREIKRYLMYREQIGMVYFAIRKCCGIYAIWFSGPGTIQRTAKRCSF